MFFPFGVDNPTRRFPYITYAIITINIAVYAAFYGDPWYVSVVYRYGLTPAHIQPLTFFTSMFMHGGLYHLAGNMMYLWIFSRNVEDLMGRPLFAAFYLICGLFAGVGHILMERGSELPMIGASGAIAGMLGAYMVLFPRSGVNCFAWFFIRKPYFFAVDARIILFLWFAMQAFNGMLSAAAKGSAIAFGAHIGGFIFGAGILWLMMWSGLIVVRNRDRVKRGELAHVSFEEDFMERLRLAEKKGRASALAQEFRQHLVDRQTLRFEKEDVLKIAELMEREGAEDNAMEAYGRLIGQFHDSPEALKARISLARLLIKNRDPRGAQSHLAWLAQNHPESQLAPQARALLQQVNMMMKPKPGTIG